jgi:heat shock protein HtpX
MLNSLKVFGLIAGLTALFIVVGGALGGEQGMFIALLLAVVLNFVAYFNSGTAALRAFQARSVSRDEAPELHDMPVVFRL